MPRLKVETDAIKNFYDTRYEGEYMREHKGLDLYRVKSALSEIPVAVTNVLDYGCGQGGWTAMLAEKFPQAELCGIDISARAIALAAKRHAGQEFSVFDGEKAPMPDASFDFIYSYHVLEHVADLEKTISDISRLLKKNGYLCAILPCANKDSFEERITRLVRNGKEPSIDSRERFFYDDVSHIRRLNNDELIRLFAANGIKIHKELYAYQFWGAIKWISKSGPAVICQIFNYKMGVNLLAKMKLLALRLAFLLLAIPMRLYMADLEAKIRSDVGIIRKIFLFALMPFKILALPIGGAVDILALIEWRFRRTRKNGSAQYLIFRK